jgi:hypothetical protein
MSNNPDSRYKPEPLPIYAVDRTAHLHGVKPTTSRTRAQFERAFRRVLQGAGVIKPDPLPRRWPCIWDVKQSTLAELHEQRPLAPRFVVRVPLQEERALSHVHGLKEG